ncbi:GNAT family N-acetyltransferase [Gracilimonas mengyeensis]|uniref:Acetyltransferase (GNAT) family protein n=1 Tax=Gracilimonas mengyeensis TaxID=1302730 RepID=A0A521E1T9_9BACT|nr:GNAT family N-acetyltransferase [Gracilimonas mengyeensis]SMO77852.1 Acetyltransferase (GNAT) family protein [Gracilimonas mengyeensis]
MIAEADVQTDVKIIKADLNNTKHASDIVKIVDLFARDPMGQDQPLDEEVRVDMIAEMKKIPTTMTYIAYLGEKAMGIVTCFIGFSTFTASKVFKIHDVAVKPEARGYGVGTKLLETVKQEAKDMGCSKITLEVREDNPARNLYEKVGFEYGDPKWYFMTKDLA